MSLETLLTEERIRRGVPTWQWTTYKTGGPAAYVFDATSAADIADLVPVTMPVLVIGKGSNLVVADAGFDGLVIRLGGAFIEIDVDDDGIVSAGAAASLPVVARTAAKAGRGGLEWMVGVPGSVGGAVCMNAGCFGSDTSACLVTAELCNVATGEWRSAGPVDLAMSYRRTNVAPEELVTQARFATVPADPAELEATMRSITRWRREHQPGGTYNAGSVFKNPDGDAAGRLIDAAGLKGTSVGGASVSTKHANFFVADSDASAQDIYDLMRTVRQVVHARMGVLLEAEIRFVGFDGEQ